MSGEIHFSESYKQVSEETDKVTIQDVANALGISKTTVSRAMSGKGRIGEETRRRVFDYIKEHGYKPNPIAKGLAQQKTYNIGWVMPGDTMLTDLPFFQKCMAGICEEAAQADYDVLLSIVYGDNISGLERIVQGSKVDGVILGRTMVDDANVAYLKESGIPFVAIGSTTQDGVVQIDDDHESACCELTQRLIDNGNKKIILIGGSDKQVVNCTRRQGFEKAMRLSDMQVEYEICMNSDSEDIIKMLVDKALNDGTDCIVCMDDKICSIVYDVIEELDLDGNDAIGIASFYDSELIAHINKKIDTIVFNPKRLGMQACKVLLIYINGDKVPEKTYMDYKISCTNPLVFSGRPTHSQLKP